MICPKCGVTFEDPSFFRCPRCGWQHPDPLSQREGLPLEHRREIGRIVALWETTKLLLLSPTTAMRMMRNDRPRDACSTSGQ